MATQIFDKKNNAVNAIFAFIEEAMELGESCLIHSLHGKSRACAVLAAYLMKKYSWSLSKCLEFVNAKKEGLELRNNYLIQMQELEKRMLAEGKLSSSWNEIKNEEDLILANTFYNSKKPDSRPQAPLRKTPKKRLTWNDKLVQKPPPATTANLSSTLGRLKEESKPTFKPKSILKGDIEKDEKEEEEVTEEASDVQLPEDRFISTINGNIVHVTVNNFITTEKKAEQAAKVYNTRPFSSDAKERDKKPTPPAGRLFGNETGMATTFKNPYEMKQIGKIGSNPKAIKKREEIRNPVMAYERPTSANISNGGSDKKRVIKPTTTTNPLSEKLGYEMMVTGSGPATGSSAKKRYPSSNPKEDSFKWK